MPCRIAKSYYFPDRHLHQTFSPQRVLQDMTLLCSLNPYTQPRCSHEYRSGSHCEKTFRLRRPELRQDRVEIGPKREKTFEGIGSASGTGAFTMSGIVNGIGLATFVDTSQSLNGVNVITSFSASTNVVPDPEPNSLFL